MLSDLKWQFGRGNTRHSDRTEKGPRIRKQEGGSGGAPGVSQEREEASTGLPFHLNNKGFLDHAPTLRVFAYDQLGSLDPNS